MMAGEKLNLILGFHSHIPLRVLKDNTYHETIRNYLGIIEFLKSFKSIKTNFHFSGSLITYLDKYSESFSQNIRSLLDLNQLELLGGGIYEPVFPFIPKEDRQVQLLLMNRILAHLFGYTPSGAWIPKFVWEPTLALDLAKSRMQYTCLSKEYFTPLGINEKELTGYYITEEEGRKLAIFPISYCLNSLTERFTPEEAINDLLKSYNHQDTESDSAIVLFYNNPILEMSKLNWLKSFIQNIDKKSDLIETKLLNNYFTKTKPKGRIYLGAFQDVDLHNGSKLLKHFLLRHPEANLLHKKMLRVSKKINSAKEGKSRFKVIKEMINQAQDLLLQGQSNDVYWDSLFGGIYLPEERQNTYANLIKAENLIDSASRQGTKWIQLSEIDYDCDGNDEIIIETETQNIYISPALGGTILEHDYRPRNINITSTISRKEEPYHNTEVKTTNGNLIYDKYLKLSLIDHFLSTDISLKKCKSNELDHLTKKIFSPYIVEKIKAKEETCKISFLSDIKLIKITGNPEVQLQKQISTRSGDSSVLIDYALINKSTESISFIFGVEFNINLSPINECNCYIDGEPNNSQESKNIKQFLIQNKLHKINFSISWTKESTLFQYPLETIILKDQKLEKIIQGITLLPTWLVKLEPEPSIPWELSIKQEINSSQEEI